MRKEWREGWLRWSGASPLRGDNACYTIATLFLSMRRHCCCAPPRLFTRTPARDKALFLLPYHQTRTIVSSLFFILGNQPPWVLFLYTNVALFLLPFTRTRTLLSLLLFIIYNPPPWATLHALFGKINYFVLKLFTCWWYISRAL